MKKHFIVYVGVFNVVLLLLASRHFSEDIEIVISTIICLTVINTVLILCDCVCALNAEKNKNIEKEVTQLKEQYKTFKCSFCRFKENNSLNAKKKNANSNKKED